jgi:hypothetical protein
MGPRRNLDMEIAEIFAEPVYEVLNPRGFAPEIKQVSLSPRVPDLDSKVVYVIDSGIYGAYLFTRRVAELLPKYFPTVKVVYKDKLSGWMTSDPELWDEVAKKANVFIYGPAGGTSGHEWGARWSVLLEKNGVPGVYVLSEGYEQVVQIACEGEGMPQLRRVVTPMPAWGAETLDHMDEIMKQIIDNLTIPLTDEEKKTGTLSRKKPARIAMKGTLAEVQKYFYEQKWTDGLPIIPPTEATVAEMVKGTSQPSDKIVTHAMLPQKWAVTVEKVAINSVMSGCKPADMPVLLAMVEAFSKSLFEGMVVSANSFSFMVVVNGPIRREIGMNSGVNALGPGNQANATIGRAMRLFLTNLGGLTPGVNLMACQGNPSNYSFAFAENEEASPWDPLHVSMGYKREESVVTIFAGGWNHGGNRTGQGRQLLSLDGIIEVIRVFQLPSGAAVLLSPLLSRAIAKEKGFSKQDLQNYLWESTLKTAYEFRSDGHYTTIIERNLKGKGTGGMKRIWPEWYLRADPGKMVPVYGRSEFIYPIVVGGENFDGFQGWKMERPSSVSVDNWR